MKLVLIFSGISSYKDILDDGKGEADYYEFF